MKYIKYLSIITLFAFIFSGCSPMDEKYSEFVANGPITYIAKLNSDSIKVYSGRNRIKFSWPKSTDPRGKHAVVYWANKAEKYEADVNPDGRTEITVESLAEGSYIFDIYVTDDLGNSSISATVTGEVYGENYEKYLINRAVTDFSIKEDHASITFANIVDNTIVDTEIEWKQGGQLCKTNVDSSQVTGALDGFKALSFRYRTVYTPGVGAIDRFYSPYTYYLMNNVEPKDIVFEKNKDSKTLTFTLPDKIDDIRDDYWGGFKISWKGGNETRILPVPINEKEITIQDYAGTEIVYQTLFQFEEVSDILYSAEKVFSTVVSTDLDRTEWTVTASQNPLATDSSPDINGIDGTKKLIDGNNATCLSLVKPNRTLGGITTGSEPIYFIIDMKSLQVFNYFKIHHRDGQGAGLRLQGASLYGNNDGSENWEIIKENVSINSTPTNADIKIDLNIDAKYEYQYIKVVYTQWDTTASNSIQITEFKLGLTE